GGDLAKDRLLRSMSGDEERNSWSFNGVTTIFTSFDIATISLPGFSSSSSGSFCSRPGSGEGRLSAWDSNPVIAFLKSGVEPAGISHSCARPWDQKDMSTA